MEHPLVKEVLAGEELLSRLPRNGVILLHTFFGSVEKDESEMSEKLSSSSPAELEQLSAEFQEFFDITVVQLKPDPTPQLQPRWKEKLEKFAFIIQVSRLYNLLTLFSEETLLRLFSVLPTVLPLTHQYRVLQELQHLLLQLSADALKVLNQQLQLTKGDKEQKLMDLLSLKTEHFPLIQPISRLVQLDQKVLLQLKELVPGLKQVQLYHIVKLNASLEAHLTFQFRTLFGLLKSEEKVFKSSKLTSHLKLKIVEQPPPRMVYKRNLKPNPSVMVATVPHQAASTTPTTSVPPASAPFSSPLSPQITSFSAATLPAEESALFDRDQREMDLQVVPILVRADNQTQLHNLLSGGKPVKVFAGGVAVFKKLKIMSTSHQQGEAMFTLRFELRRYFKDDHFELVDSIQSDPFFIFSHSTQIKPTSTTTPVINEVIPSFGPTRGNSRVAILGGQFLDGPGLKIKFDETEVKPMFHAPGTLICHTPPHGPGMVSVSVTNDGKNYVSGAAVFNYLDPQPIFTNLTTTVGSQGKSL